MPKNSKLKKQWSEKNREFISELIASELSKIIEQTASIDQFKRKQYDLSNRLKLNAQGKINIKQLFEKNSLTKLRDIQVRLATKVFNLAIPFRDNFAFLAEKRHLQTKFADRTVISYLKLSIIYFCVSW